MYSILLINQYFISVIMKMFKKLIIFIYKIELSIKIMEHNITLIVIGKFRKWKVKLGPTTKKENYRLLKRERINYEICRLYS